MRYDTSIRFVTKSIPYVIKPMRYFLLFFIASSYSCFSQAPITDTMQAKADCKAAKKVIISKTTQLVFTKAPNGGGTSEISCNSSNSGYAFEKEHNTSWHQLIFKIEGNLCFTIKPFKKDDDYDFMLFKSEDTNTCKNIRKLKPIRANISRDKEEIDGATGLKATSTKELIKEGVNDAYSKSLQVQKGDTFYLAIDNVYANGEGFNLDIFFERAVVLKGQLVDENNTPVKGEVVITNAGGKEVAKTETDSVTGVYKLNALLRERTNYYINYSSDGHFFFTKQFTAEDTTANKLQTQVLSTLKAGKKNSVGAINFFGDQDVYVKASEPALKNLLKLMRKESSIKIKIIGHTNGCGPSNYKGGSKGLSEGRALAIKKYLEKNSIEGGRIATEGKDCKEMLYSETGFPWQQEANRRVEIEILEN
jgi:outer membrane protein OmpA-like peptidoglycan-associated protein